MAMTPLGWKIYYGDGTIRTSRQSTWEGAPSTNVQFVAIIYAETYQRSVQDGYDEQGNPINQRWITEHYLDTFKEFDYYWFDPATLTGGGSNLSADVPAGALVKRGRSMTETTWRNLLAQAEEDRQAP